MVAAWSVLADDDPAREVLVLVLVWLPASMFFYRRRRLGAGTA